MPFTEDLTPFFSEAGFAHAATLDGDAVSVIFDTPVEAALGGGLLAAQPVAVLPTADVPAGVEGKSLVVAGDTYTVREHRSDGTGVSTLLLTAA